MRLPLRMRKSIPIYLIVFLGMGYMSLVLGLTGLRFCEAWSSCTGLSESKVCAGHGSTDPNATEENATRKVVMNSLLVTLFLVAALMIDRYVCFCINNQ